MIEIPHLRRSSLGREIRGVLHKVIHSIHVCSTAHIQRRERNQGEQSLALRFPCGPVGGGLGIPRCSWSRNDPRKDVARVIAILGVCPHAGSAYTTLRSGALPARNTKARVPARRREPASMAAAAGGNRMPSDGSHPGRVDADCDGALKEGDRYDKLRFRLQLDDAAVNACQRTRLDPHPRSRSEERPRSG